METQINITSVGDIMLGDSPLKVGFGVGSLLNSKENYNPFINTSDILINNDIVIGNLEAVLSDDGLIPGNFKSVQMRGDNNSIKYLKAAGINYLSVANNHMMQHGRSAFCKTVDLLNDNNIYPIGVSCPLGKVIPVFNNVKGLRICLIAYSMRPEKYCLNPGYAHCSIEEIIEDIRKYKKASDLIVVSLHWGDEHVDCPSSKQIKQARSLIDEGVSLVLGHHPHVIQGIETYKDGLIAYSLGNFVFDFWQIKMRKTMVLQVTFAGKTLVKFKRIPMVIDTVFRPTAVFGSECIEMLKEYSVLDQKIKNADIVDRYGLYELKVKLGEIKNKFENRLYFCRNFFQYKDWVRRQSLKSFILGRFIRNNLLE